MDVTRLADPLQRQHLRDLRGLAFPGRQDRRGKPLPLAGDLIGALVIDPRLPHRHRPGRRGDLPRLVVAVRTTNR